MKLHLWFLLDSGMHLYHTFVMRLFLPGFAVTARLPSQCCHHFAVTPFTFHNQTVKWQSVTDDSKFSLFKSLVKCCEIIFQLIPTRFYSFPYRFDSFHHRGHGGHRGYNYLWIRTLKPLRPPCPLWWNSSFMHRNKSIFKDVIVLNQIPQFPDWASKLSHT